MTSTASAFWIQSMSYPYSGPYTYVFTNIDTTDNIAAELLDNTSNDQYRDLSFDFGTQSIYGFGFDYKILYGTTSLDISVLNDLTCTVNHSLTSSSTAQFFGVIFSEATFPQSRQKCVHLLLLT